MAEEMNSQSKVDSMQGQINSISKLIEQQNQLLGTLMKSQVRSIFLLLTASLITFSCFFVP